MHHLKVAVVHNAIAPYRHALFEALSRDVDLMVYYCSAKHSSRKWELWPRNYNYRYKVLPRIPLKTSIIDQSLNLSIIKELVLSKPHILILSDYNSPTVWLALIIAKLLKIHIIYWTEGIREPQSILGKISRPLRTLFARESDSTVVPGGLSRNYVISLGANAEKVFIAPNAIDNELFITLSRKYQLHKEELKGQFELKGKVVILYIGRLLEEKGVTFLLEAYGKLKFEINGIALFIVGYGKLGEILQKLCRTKKIDNVFFTGGVADYKQVIRYYSMADVFVLPTLADVWGFVINEAMACGLPVVATRASQAAQEMIRSGDSGYVIKEADSEELHNALRNLICDSELREKMAERSREIVEHEFDVRHMVKGFLSAIEYCTNGIRK